MRFSYGGLRTRVFRSRLPHPFLPPHPCQLFPHQHPKLRLRQNFHSKNVLASPLKLATTGLKILFDHCQMTSSRLINVVFVDENQIGKTRSNGDQQYDIKSHASDGQTKYEAHCTIARKRRRPVRDRGLLDLDRPDWLRISNSSFRHEHP